MNKFRLVLAVLFVWSLPVAAQRMFGVAMDNWNTTGGLYLNPANIADSRSRLTFDIVSGNVLVDNDLGTINTNKLGTVIAKGKVPAMNNVLDFTGKSQGSLIAPYGEVRGPGFSWNIDHKNSIALTTRVRGNSQFTNIDPGIYGAVLNADYAKNGGKDFSTAATAFHWNTAAWGEVGLSYARVIKDDDDKFLALGMTARYLGGISYNSLSGNNIDANYYSANDSLRLSNVNLKYSTNVPDDAHAAKQNTPVPQLLGRFFGNKGGSGAGADIGISYEYRPDYASYKYNMDGKTGIVDHSAPRYKLKLSASITDIGAIYYGAKYNRVETVNGGGYIIKDGLAKNVFNFRDFYRYTKGHSFSVDTSRHGTTYYLPTALLLAADYKMGRHVYLNATAVYNLADRNATGAYFYNQMTITPRYETCLFSIGLPITYASQSSSLKMGLGVRVAGFFMGSDDLLAGSGFNCYMGGFVPVNYTRPADRDGDLVSDKKDMCPDVPGLWAFQGCPDPDKDHDGIPDSVDKCPTVKGVSSAQGCPDKDGDGVTDAKDRCPDKAGPASLKGCPDTDGDGIVDIDDACPDKPGTLAMKGCPDTDGDGVPDNLDKCPTEPGLAANNGCPEQKPTPKEATSPLPALTFETGKAIIKKGSYPLLDDAVNRLNADHDNDMLILGYTDNVGGEPGNLRLSLQRALSVRSYFTRKGIAPARMTTKGMGSANPVAPNDTPEGRAMNRRVELILKKK